MDGTWQKTETERQSKATREREREREKEMYDLWKDTSSFHGFPEGSEDTNLSQPRPPTL